MRKKQPRVASLASAIDLTPMLDVVFIMLIFFIVTASFTSTPGIEVSRTEASSADPMQAAILVAIDDADAVWIDNQQVAADAIKLALLRLHTENPRAGLVIQADNGSSLQALARVADTARSLGIKDVAVSTLTE